MLEKLPAWVWESILFFLINSGRSQRRRSSKVWTSFRAVKKINVSGRRKRVGGRTTQILDHKWKHLFKPLLPPSSYPQAALTQNRRITPRVGLNLVALVRVRPWHDRKSQGMGCSSWNLMGLFWVVTPAGQPHQGEASGSTLKLLCTPSAGKVSYCVVSVTWEFLIQSSWLTSAGRSGLFGLFPPHCLFKLCFCGVWAADLIGGSVAFHVTFL